MKKINYICAVLSLVFLNSCEGYLGTKTDLGFIEVPNYSVRDIAYVPIQPAFSGFVYPNDICIGFDELFYICLLYTSPSPRDVEESRMPSSA